MKLTTTRDGRSYLVPFLLVTSLFFMWGFAHAILEVLNPHLKNLLGLNHTNAAWVQVATYAAYFLMAIPAGKIIQRWGYRGGVLTGLVLYGVGALLFLPICVLGAKADNPALLYPAFIALLFIIGCGLTCLETSANPYVTVLGPKASAEQRINLAQSLNGLGWICGPLVGGLFFFGDEAEGQVPSIASVATPYVIVGVFVLLAALGFKFSRLPEPSQSQEPSVVSQDKEPRDPSNSPSEADNREKRKEKARTPSLEGRVGEGFLFRSRIYVLGVIALFLYVAAQTGVNSNFVAYMGENVAMSRAEASLWLSFGGMGLFFIGRLVGSWLMGYVRADRLLLLYAVGATVGSLVIVSLGGRMSIGAFFLVYLCESIMFPTIFSLALRGAEGNTKQASSYLIMTIVGGAVAPPLMGCIADASSIGLAFVVPMICYIFIGIYAHAARLKD
ncbi:MAG: sugar MFS transporter [Bacteroidales bacterium]|nr:sugar MFS transporter [Bacteroidales bacterium]